MCECNESESHIECESKSESECENKCDRRSVSLCAYICARAHAFVCAYVRACVLYKLLLHRRKGVHECKWTRAGPGHNSCDVLIARPQGQVLGGSKQLDK